MTNPTNPSESEWTTWARAACGICKARIDCEVSHPKGSGVSMPQVNIPSGVTRWRDGLICDKCAALVESMVAAIRRELLRGDQ